jgi:D-alanyl-D-alanine carboxypeptidase
MPDPDLFTIISKEYGISKEYAPDDLVPLEDHLPYSVTVGYPNEVREIILQPLVEMINDMLEEGLQPWILSGYRSYAAQAISWDKWNRLYPETAAIVSAQPGHSEHQLGTVIDFGSPELRGIVGQPDVEFHTYFYKTSEGLWLAENAHTYGFTMSFTKESFETTGFYYEPWHFRYVGKEMAQLLRDQNLTLTEYKLANEPPPCTP